MRTVTLQRLTLLNFKNIRNAELTFNHTATTISGANGTGKTTIFDAFTWVLFGKDSKGRTKFNLKTIDNATGETIDRLPHEVTAVLNVDGQTIELTRRLEEKWVKAKGATTEEFKGHDEKRLYNGVEQSVKDWQAKIDAICPEQVFRYLTDPTAFTAQKADAQREMLFDLAGRVSDEEVAGDNADFVALLAGLSGKSIEERRKEISAKRKRLNAEAVSLPDRIDEQQRRLSELSATDYTATEQELTATEQRLATIDAQLAGNAIVGAEEDEAISKLNEQIRRLQAEQQNVADKAYQAEHTEYTRIVDERASISNEYKALQNKATELICEARNIEDTAQRLTQERDQLRQEFEELKTQAFDPELADVCPTCGHLFTAEEITAMRGKLYTCWHAEQTAKRNAIRERGRKLNEDITAHLAKAKELHTKADDLQVTAKALFATIPQTAGVPSREAIANRTPEYLAIGAEIDELKAQRQALYDKPTEKRDATALREAKSECIADIKRLTLALAGREEMEKASKRIADLEKQVQETAQAIADLEREDDTIMLFNRAKTEAVESKINGLFEVTRFKMFAKQINGQEVETCEATADNVPFSTLNTAMRINVGLDIINAMCRAYDITVPIFIDNAEAVNQLLPTQSQMVKLAVSTETTLTLTET